MPPDVVLAPRRSVARASSRSEGAAPKAGRQVVDVVLGPVIQCLEAASLGMPFETWKTRMGRFRDETTTQAFRAVWREGGGPGAFWAGTSAKMVESASKGAILMVSKEAINDALVANAGASPAVAGALAGAGGGVAQVSVMAPCTFLVTGAVTGDKSIGTWERARRTYAAKGIAGFYPGGTAIAFRQATNWASRQGFTEAVRSRLKDGDPDAKLTKTQEVVAGVIGGTLSCWNHPFEMARIEAQARAEAGQTALSMPQVFRLVLKEQGVAGLFAGVIPRIGLGIWQTLFMVTGAKLVKQELAARGYLEETR